MLAREKPDVVHLHLYRATLYGRVAALLARVPVVITTEHSLLDGVLEGRPTTGAVRRLYRATEPLNTMTVAVSPDVADRLQRWGVPQRKLTVIPNGIDTAAWRESGAHRASARRELGLSDDVELIGGVGRLSATKRWDLLLRAVAPILSARRQVVLIGGGEEEASLRELAASLGVADWVRFLGTRLDVLPLLSALDVVASPSPQETFGLALLEALAAGRPIVYVHCPSLTAIGPLDGVRRSPGEEAPFREAVLAALRGPSEVAPPEDLNRYDIRTVAARVDDIYDTCLSQKESR